MMFGTRDAFPYFECGSCGCLQIAEVPTDLASYYPAGYYSLAPAEPPAGLKGWIRNIRNRRIFTGRGILGGLLSMITRYPYADLGPWLAGHPSGKKARVLDVGSGAGYLINDLALAGYPAPLGIDPFIEEPIEYESGARVLKAGVAEVEGEFDLIILNHVLEHIADQAGTLAATRRLLAEDGYCVVRTPTTSSYAWRHYRENWVQLDAPRHLVIHSLDSIERVARGAGLAIVDVRYDSGELQFTGSELYSRDIPTTGGGGVFSRRELREFRRRAARLNADRQGDQIAVLLRAEE